MNILLVEHQKALVEIVKQGLEKEGCAVHLASSDLEGLAEAGRNTFDSILVDCAIPASGGVSLVRSLRQAGCAGPIVMLLRSRDTGERIEGLDAGADSCLSQPIALPELLAFLRALTRRRGRLPALVRVADLEIDSVRQCVRRSGRLIRLTRREYDLLEVLVRHRGQVLTRSAIHEKIYGCAANNYSNVVDVYVRYLRRKIETGFGTPLILTRWGEGYMFRNGAS